MFVDWMNTCGKEPSFVSVGRRGFFCLLTIGVEGQSQLYEGRTWSCDENAVTKKDTKNLYHSTYCATILCKSMLFCRNTNRGEQWRRKIARKQSIYNGMSFEGNGEGAGQPDFREIKIPVRKQTRIASSNEMIEGYRRKAAMLQRSGEIEL
ncbi:MAG: hypothetical protein IJ468_15170 [Lachnospiraceae bacterium]|nr:hypothetical protein [Lachnospiraceae bacterium]